MNLFVFKQSLNHAKILCNVQVIVKKFNWTLFNRDFRKFYENQLLKAENAVR